MMIIIKALLSITFLWSCVLSDKPQDVCFEPKEVGLCKAYFPSYFYNATAGECQKFVYGGCQGNENRFKTLEECQNICDPCKLPLESGPCEAYFPSYYFNAVEKQCQQFIYGGCQGNQNRFTSIKECMTKCSQICKFYHLSAECYHKIDNSLVQIQVSINKCSDPVDVTVNIQSEKRDLTWKYTFTKMDEAVDIPGFDVEVVLVVKQGFRNGDIYTVNAGLEIEGQQKANFLQQEVNLTPDGSCFTLTSESIIAIAVLVPVFLLASVALIAVLVMWRKSIQQTKLQNNSLLCNGVQPDLSDPPVTFRDGHVNMNVENDQTLNNDMQPNFSAIPGYDESMRY